MSDGRSSFNHSIPLLCWLVYEAFFPTNRTVFQGKSVTLRLSHTFFLFPKMLIYPSSIFSSTNVMLLGQVFTLERYFLLSLST